MSIFSGSPLIVLTGPTAVGKTKLSLELARAVDGEIISADSMQVYRHMDIGSAKISPAERQGIPHHLIDILDPWEAFSVALFQMRCKECLAEIYGRGKIPILVGGTGFYIQAVLKDVDFVENQDNAAYREELERLAKEKGDGYLHALLAQADPASAEAIHPRNVKRCIRALEYFHLTGERISEHNAREREHSSPYNVCYFVLNDDREKIYARIEKRVDEMLEQGLLEEVQRLKGMGCHKGMVSMQGLGYKEILACLEGETTLEEAVRLLKRNTRHFAKRQLTWFRREADVVWVDKSEFGYDQAAILGFMGEELQRRGLIE